jgi:acetolactate synthase I/II/III large subunit
VRLCDRLGIGVLESVPNAMNFPADHPMHVGNQWNQPVQNPALAEADAILVIDSDVPWIPAVSRPRDDAVIHHVDVDPLKQQMPLWYIGARTSHRADPAAALAQLADAAEAVDLDDALVAERRAYWAGQHRERRARLDALEARPGREDAINGEYVVAQVRRHLDEASIVISEGISHYHTIGDHLALSRPGSLYNSGGGSLGWNGGAAIGAKLARPEATVVALCGDGSYLFSVPSSVHWIARAYDAPFLTVVLNNRGWKSPKLSALAVHPQGYASRANALDVAFDPPPDHAGIAAAAGGAAAFTVRRPEEVEAAVAEAFRVVREERRCAVLDVWVTPL